MQCSDSNKLRTAFDYVPSDGGTPADSERERLKGNIKTYFSTLKAVTPERAEEIRLKVVERLKKAGHEDAEELIDEYFVAWARKRKSK